MTFQTGPNTTLCQYLINYISEGVAVLRAAEDGADFVFVEFNRAAQQMDDIPRGEVIGRKLTEIFPGIEEFGLLDVLRRVHKTGQSETHRKTHYKDDAREFDHQHFVYRMPNGQVVLVFTDVSRQKSLEAEAEEVKAQLYQAQKMEAIGRLAGGIAHDFNNLLGAIMGNAELALMDLAQRDPLFELVNEIKAASDKAATLTRQLLAFSRKQVVTPKVVVLNDVISDVQPMLARLVGRDVQMVYNLQKNLGRIRIDPGQFDQILMNLVINARDAMDGHGALTIATRDVRLSSTDLPYDKTAGQYVQLSIKDTGCGMNRETCAKIFEPFFTTKKEGRGTGLGLATVFGIVQQNEGIIDVHSVENVGTEFVIWLPAVADAAEKLVRSVPPTPQGNGETVLVVEEDTASRGMTERQLRRLGYNPLLAESSNGAFVIERHFDGPIHVLLTDLRLEGVDGRTLFSDLRQKRPALRVLYVSGRGLPEGDDDAYNNLDGPFLAKPYTMNELAVTLRLLVDE